MDLFPNVDPSDRPSSSDDKQGCPAGSSAERGQARSPHGWVWRGTKLVFGVPVVAFPLGQIVRNGRQLGQIVSDLRRGPKPPRAVSRQQDGTLDMAAMAFMSGLSEGEWDERLARRRRQIAITAYLAFGLGWVFVVAWLLRLLGLDGTGQRLLAALQFAPFCMVFFLTAFKHAHANWQLRTGLLGSAGDYLRSTEPFWPRF